MRSGFTFVCSEFAKSNQDNKNDEANYASYYLTVEIQQLRRPMQ
jgi:hypothetical protein